MDKPEKDPTLPQRAVEAIETLIEFIGDDMWRPGLVATPGRVLAAWRQCWGSGYDTPPPAMTMFKEEGKQYDEMVTVCDINFYSTCEHHMAPFFGTADVSYIPGTNGVVGISKLARAVEHFSRRLQNQERLTEQIADFIVAAGVSPDVGVRMRATHMCMVSRGVRQAGTSTITTSLRGDYKTDPTVRAEFLAGLK